MQITFRHAIKLLPYSSLMLQFPAKPTATTSSLTKTAKTQAASSCRLTFTQNLWIPNFAINSCTNWASLLSLTHARTSNDNSWSHSSLSLWEHSMQNGQFIPDSHESSKLQLSAVTTCSHFKKATTGVSWPIESQWNAKHFLPYQD